MTTRWRLLAKKVDDAADFWWGELMVFRPWTTGGDFTGDGPDGARPVTSALGVEITSYVMAGQGGGPAGGAAFVTRVEERTLIYSLQGGALLGAKVGDHVELPDRNLVCEIAMMPPEGDDATNRPRIHLTRLGPNTFGTKFGDWSTSEAADSAAVAASVA